MPSQTSPTFVPPRPGQWELERTHSTRPMSGFMASLAPEHFKRGFREAMSAYGALLDHLDMVAINGFMYSAPRPVAAPLDAKGHPPRAVFWLLQRLQPEIRRRIRRAAEIFADRFWREELRWWDAEVKPMLAREGRALLAEDLAGMSNVSVSEHLQRAADFAGKTIYFHHRLNGCAIIPLGDFIAHVAAWTGEPATAILLAMRGHSPLSAGATEEVAAVRAAIAADPEALALVGSGRAPADILVALGSLQSVGPALRAYLDTAGWRVLGGYDVADRHAREHPELLLNVIRSGVRSRAQGTELSEGIKALRSKVPPAHQAEFDSLLAEAQLTYRVRDERNFCSDSIGIGVARRALLAAGERLTSAGLLHEAEHAVDATVEELRALLEGRGGPSADELASRTMGRLTSRIEDAPRFLGIPPSAPPPADWLPPGAARLQRAVDVSLQLMFAVPAKQEGRGTHLKGFAVSPGTVEGPARVIRDVSELPLVKDGEVLVTPSTGPTFNVVLPLLRAIVTERGGALSHAAIVAREYGIPAVVGCRDATARVKTGTRVRVDGTKGEMWILD